jgi:hypothetical protein
MDRATYIIHIWRSRALAGCQWVARVEHLSDGQRHRFANPEELLEHLRGVLLSSPQQHREIIETHGESTPEER